MQCLLFMCPIYNFVLHAVAMAADRGDRKKGSQISRICRFQIGSSSLHRIVGLHHTHLKGHMHTHGTSDCSDPFPTTTAACEWSGQRGN